ncbi:magnesium transporter [Candidatus Woesearchaeota archaeon]|nr:magnesium transporter [Candidatus Woesearchaeota archaeon]
MRILGKSKRIDKDFLEISLSELVSITGGIIAGLFLLNITKSLDTLLGLFILFPGLLEMHGNIYGSLSARLSTLLWSGKLKLKEERNKFIRENVFAVLFLVLAVSFALGVIAYLFVLIAFKTSSFLIIIVSVLSSLIGSLIEVPLTIYTTFWFFKHNFDPEDIMGPYVTTIGDIISIISIVIVVKILI